MGTDESGGKRAVFLDRDGVINRNVWNPASSQYESPLTPDAFELLPGVISALLELRIAGFLLFIVSNQPNYAKQKSSMEMLDAIHRKLTAITSRAAIEFTACYYCYHHPEGRVPGYSGLCVCRKPSPHFLLQAQREFGVDLARSWMIGDRKSDVQCGKAAGARTIFVKDLASGGGGVTADYHGADFCAADLCEAARQILSCEEPFHAGSGLLGQEHGNS